MDQEIRELLERQALWQRSRAGLSWEEKLKMSLVMRETQRALRASSGWGQDPADKSKSSPQGNR